MGDRSPGPGSYNPNVRGVFRSPPAFTMGARHREVVSEPWKLGPGTYQPKTGPSGPAYSMSAKPRDDHLEKMYFMPARVPGMPHPTPKRFLLSEVTPGPGTYTLPSTNSGPAFTAAPKRKEKNETISPGPGAYFYTPRPQTPSFTMADRYPVAPPKTASPLPRSVYGEFCNTPGPAEYRLDRNVSRGPAYTMTGKWRNHHHEK